MLFELVTQVDHIRVTFISHRAISNIASQISKFPCFVHSGEPVNPEAG